MGTSCGGFMLARVCRGHGVSVSARILEAILAWACDLLCFGVVVRGFRFGMRCQLRLGPWDLVRS